MGKLNKIFKISSTDFATLKETGQITKAGVTYKYDPDNLYLIENNLTDDYVLLGAGGSKLESELSVKYADTANMADYATNASSAEIAGYSNGVYNRPETYNTDNPVWHSTSGDSTTGMYRTLHFDSSFTYNPSTDTLKVPHLEGTATEAKKVINKLTVGTKTYDGSTAVSLTKADLGLENVNNTADKDKQVHEANLQWGGKNLSNTVSPTDAALVPKLSANRFDFCPTDHIKVEYSTDGGTTWIDYGATNDAKTSLVSSVASYGDFYIGKKTLNSSEKTTLDRLKVTLFDFGTVIYTNLRKFIVYVATNACINCWCTIRKNTKGNPDVFTEIATKATVYGWSGWNVINVPEFATYGNSDKQATAIEFIFGVDTVQYPNYPALCIRKIYAYHETCYSPVTTAYSMATAGTPYILDVNKTAIFGYPVNAKKLYEDNQALIDKYALKTAIPTVESLTTTDIDDAIK